jgi:hypothetical protein
MSRGSSYESTNVPVQSVGKGSSKSQVRCGVMGSEGKGRDVM